MRPDIKDVVIVAYDQLAVFEFGIATEVFGLRRPEIKEPWYRCRACAVESGPIRARGGIEITTTAGLASLRRAGTIVIPGWRSADERPPEALLRALRAAHARGARILTICSGVFVLAAAGLLAGRRATTHWLYTRTLAERYPDVHVQPDVLFVDEGQILTSAGSAAGLDLCLHVVRRDYGAEIANIVARRLVMPPQRDGGQAQFIPLAVPPARDSSLAPLLEWMQRRLAQPVTIAQLAHRAAMSPRTFARRFRETTGTTPYKWILHQRVMAAQLRLETSRASIDEIAEAVGLQTAATLRHHFTRALKTTPTAYRRRFARPRASSGPKGRA